MKTRSSLPGRPVEKREPSPKAFGAGYFHQVPSGQFFSLGRGYTNRYFGRVRLRIAPYYSAIQLPERSETFPGVASDAPSECAKTGDPTQFRVPYIPDSRF
jgi:hypothetical protein